MITRRRPGIRESASSHGTPVAFILLVSVLLGLASAWWADNMKPDTSGRVAATVAVEPERPKADKTPIQASGASGGNSGTDAKATASLDQAATSASAATDSEDSTALVRHPDEEKRDATGDQIEPAAKPKAASAPAKAIKKSTQSGNRRLAGSGSSQKERIKEIDRVRTQAFTEKPDSRKKARDDDAAGNRPFLKSSKTNSGIISERQRTQVALKRCTRSGNWIDREKCKWKLCGDRWGEDGCPFGRREVATY